jgi:predicted RNase H-like nuclease
MREVHTFVDVLALGERPSVIAVDVPIGLSDMAVRGGRDCERAARDDLRARRSSVFSSPSRAALECFRSDGGHAEVSRANRQSGPNAPGITLQTFHILKKISEVDRALGPPLRMRIVEVHPELCLTEANGGAPMREGKKSHRGRSERERLLVRLGYRSVLGMKRAKNVKADDVLDACIACWTACRVANGHARVVPPVPPKDERGLEMAIWV